MHYFVTTAKDGPVRLWAFSGAALRDAKEVGSLHPEKALFSEKDSNERPWMVGAGLLFEPSISAELPLVIAGAVDGSLFLLRCSRGQLETVARGQFEGECKQFAVHRISEAGAALLLGAVEDHIVTVDVL